MHYSKYAFLHVYASPLQGYEVKVSIGTRWKRTNKQKLEWKSSGLMQPRVISLYKKTCKSWIILCGNAPETNEKVVQTYLISSYCWIGVSCKVFTHTAGMLATALRLVGLRIILSRVLTMSAKRGRTLRSFCQQSSISWCKALGQSIGGGKR